MRPIFTRGGSALAVLALAATFAGGCTADTKSPSTPNSGSAAPTTTRPAPSPTTSRLPSAEKIEVSQLKLGQAGSMLLGRLWVDMKLQAHLPSSYQATTGWSHDRYWYSNYGTVGIKRLADGYHIYLPRFADLTPLPRPGYDAPPTWFGPSRPDLYEWTRPGHYIPVVAVHFGYEEQQTSPTYPRKYVGRAIDQMKEGESSCTRSWAMWRDTQGRYRLHQYFGVSISYDEGCDGLVVERLPEGYLVSNAPAGFYPPGKVAGDPGDPVVAQVRFRK